MTTAAQFRQQLADAAYASDIGPIKNAIRASALTLDEQAALLAFAKEREDEKYHAYLGKSVYPPRSYALAAGHAAPVAASAHSHLWFNTATVILISFAVLIILLCIRTAFQIAEEEERIRREHRADHERAHKANLKGHPAKR